jgi:hypothetical protein
VKAYAARLGLDADAFSGHSLRSGFLTSAAARGASLFKMMDEPAQVGGRAAGPRARCRGLPGPRGGWAAVIG